MSLVQARLAMGVVLSVLIAGCGASPPIQYYMLNSGVVTGKERPHLAPNLSVGLGPITLPEIIDRPQLVVRTNTNRVVVADTHRWAGLLKNEIPRVITENLSRILGSTNIRYYPQHGSDTAETRIHVNIQRFESVLGKTATIDAIWTIQRAGSTGRQIDSVHVQESVPDESYDAVVAAYGRAVFAVSQAIASTLQVSEAARSTP